MQHSNKCKHCGSDCGKNPIVFSGEKFCCNGCKQVYQILSENNLYTYYNFESNPGLKIDEETDNGKYNFLDNLEVVKKYIEFEDDYIIKVTLYIPTMHCASCIWLLENLSKINKGILNSNVNFTSKEVSINYNKDLINFRQLVELLSSLHYVPDLNRSNKEILNRKKTDKTLLYKLGVAGFVFGNVMLYSLPEYFNGSPIEGDLGEFLNYLCYILTFPIVFYSGSDYIKSAYKNIIKKTINIDLPIAIGVSTMFLVNTYIVFIEKGQSYSDSLSGFLFFLLLGKWYQGKTYSALAFDRDYKSYFPMGVNKIENGKEKGILLEEITKDDCLVIRNKEIIPADSILLDGNALIDYSFVTGESHSVKKNIGDFLYAGGRQVNGIIKIKTINNVNQSYLTKLWNQENNKTDKSSLKSIIDKASIHFTIAIIIISFLTAAYYLLNNDYNNALNSFVSILIVACPCALALSVPFTFGNTIRLFGNNGFYVKNSTVIEKLSKINTIVFDKTGTLTLPDNNEIVYKGKELTELHKSLLFSITSQSVHPLSIRLSEFYKNYKIKKINSFVEIDSRGMYAEYDNYKFKIGSKEFVLGEFENDKNFGSKVYFSQDEELIGVFIFTNKYRDNIPELLESLKSDYDIHLISGDNNSEQTFLRNYFSEENIHFNQKPLDKSEYIKSLKLKDKYILMTGDGLNDSGAFLESDVALSVADNIYNFSPAADIIIKASKFKMLKTYISFSRKSMIIVSLSFLISFLYNFIGLYFAIRGELSPVIAAILMPVSSVSVVLFTTFALRLIGKFNFN